MAKEGKIVWNNDIRNMDHWPGMEIDQLRQDLEEAIICRERAEHEATLEMELRLTLDHEYRYLRHCFNEKLDQINFGLRDKCMLYLDLIEAYNDGFKTITEHWKGSPHYMPKHVKKIIELRKKGGLDV